jgi:hypothetical protein
MLDWLLDPPPHEIILLAVGAGVLLVCCFLPRDE